MIVTFGKAFTVEEYRNKPDEDDEPYIEVENRELYFKDMSAIQNIAWDGRSGLIIIGGN